MSCLPNASKCEWTDLQHFVNHLNISEGIDYTRTKCLDLCSHSKQPEVLCTAANGNTLVIERKSVIWPENYAERHHAEHRLFRYLGDAVQPLLDANCAYELCISPPGTVTDKDLRGIAASIRANIASNLAHLACGKPIAAVVPIAYALRKQHLHERNGDEPLSGICISMDEEPISITGTAGGISEEFSSRLSSLLSSAPAKFANYASSRRVVLLQAVTAALYMAMDDSKDNLLEAAIIPPSVSEVWMGFEYASRLWNFNRVHPSVV